MAYVKVGGRFVHYRTPRPFKEAKGRIILLIHGAYDTHAYWRQVYGHFQRDHTPIALDLPGRGGSDGPPLETAKQFAKFIDGFVKAMKLKRVVVWGHSMGGSMAIEFAARRKKRVAGLIAMSSSPDWSIPKAEIAQWKKDPDAAFKANLGHLFAKKTPVGVVEGYDKQLRSVPPGTCRADIAACGTFACEPKLKRVKAPTLIVTGDEEAWLDGSLRLKDGIAGAVLTIVPQAGHAIALEQPQKLCAAVDSFLARLG